MNGSANVDSTLSGQAAGEAHDLGAVAAQDFCQPKEIMEKKMSNWIDYNLDVLAGSPAEINQIAEKLNQPSLELANWIAQRDGQPVSGAAGGLQELLEFKAVRNLSYVSNDFNKTRRFSFSFKDRHYGIIVSHLAEVSVAFPGAVFLL
jgi:hypothetical protein